MRPLITISLAVVLVAGCAGNNASTAAPTAPPAASPTVAVEPATPADAPLASVTAVSARVTFDGNACVYTGPTVIPFPASMTIEYAPDSSVRNAWIGIMAIRSGTTEAELNDPTLPDVGVGTPTFVYPDSHVFTQGAGRFEYRAVADGSNPMADPAALGDRPYDTHLVYCLPTLPGRPVGGFTILHVVAGDESSSPSAGS